MDLEGRGARAGIHALALRNTSQSSCWPYYLRRWNHQFQEVLDLGEARNASSRNFREQISATPEFLTAIDCTVRVGQNAVLSRFLSMLQERSPWRSHSTSRVVVPDEVLERGIENESIILNLNSENYYGLDEMGRHIWLNARNHPRSIQEAFDRLLAEYDVDEQTLRADLIEFVSVLVEHGLIELHAPDLE